MRLATRGALEVRSRRLGVGPGGARASHGGGRRSFFFQRERPCLLGIEGLEAPRDFPRLARAAVDEARRELAGAAQLQPLALVSAIDSASNRLCRIADAAELCRNVHPDEKFVASANEAVQEIAGYMGEVNLDSTMYEGMRRAESRQEFGSLPLEAQRVLTHMRASMEHEGIHLQPEEKEECLELLDREQSLAFGIVQRHERQRRSATDGEDGAWVPAAGAQAALGSDAERLPRRSSPSLELFVPAEHAAAEHLMRTARCPETRRRLHEARAAQDEHGEGEMAELLRVRQRLAGLRGYQTWCEYAQREALFQSPDRVERFLDAAWERLQPGLEMDLRVLAQEKQDLGLGEPVLQAWDVPLLLSSSRERHRQDEDVSEYLSYGSLMRGVELILSELLGLRFVAEQPGPGEVWHPSVQKYTLREGDEVLGVLYMDPFARPGKVVQSAQFTLQGSKALEDGRQQVPKTTLVYALPVGLPGLPMSFAVTFMHEIGHAVHSLLSATSFQHLSGTRGAVDFVEFPSHLFEHYVLDPDCLSQYASHSKTGAPIPTELLRSAAAGHRRFAHFDAAQHLMYAAVDQAFYSFTPPGAGSGGGDVSAVREHLGASLSRFGSRLEGPYRGEFTELLGLSKISKFDHLVHYAGSYYCYLFNRALSSHVWSHGFRPDPFGATPGRRLRELLRGGSVVQTLDAITALCPGSGAFAAEDVPLDALVATLGG